MLSGHGLARRMQIPIPVMKGTVLIHGLLLPAACSSVSRIRLLRTTFQPSLSRKSGGK